MKITDTEKHDIIYVFLKDKEKRVRFHLDELESRDLKARLYNSFEHSIEATKTAFELVFAEFMTEHEEKHKEAILFFDMLFAAAKAKAKEKENK